MFEFNFTEQEQIPQSPQEEAEYYFNNLSEDSKQIMLHPDTLLILYKLFKNDSRRFYCSITDVNNDAFEISIADFDTKLSYSFYCCSLHEAFKPAAIAALFLKYPTGASKANATNTAALAEFPEDVFYKIALALPQKCMRGGKLYYTIGHKTLGLCTCIISKTKNNE